ncbi:MAG TPA: hypothetical protein VF746_17450 [Longimicrobium sp.]|jgi:hypothetical protein
MVFFLVTNFLVVQGLIALLHPPGEAAARAPGRAAPGGGPATRRLPGSA